MTKPRAIVLSAAAVVLALAGLVAVLAHRAPMPAAPVAQVVAATRPAPPATTAKATPAAVDPYTVYLAAAPAGAVRLSREDAQTRAYLGCGRTFAPGTIDAALADAYRPTGICGSR